MLGLDENYLNWYFRMLTTFGMWNPWEKNDDKNILYTFYALGLFCFTGLPPSFGEIIHTWKNRKNIIGLSQHFIMSTAMISTLAKIINLWRRKADLEIVLRLLNWERLQPCNRQFAMYRDEIIMSTMRASRLFSLTFYIMVFWYLTFSYGKDFLYSNGNLDKLSTSPVLLFGSNETSLYWLIFIIDKTTVTYMAGCTASHDTFFMVFLMHVGGQLDLLKRRLELCQDKISYSHKNDLIVKDYTIYDLKIECICRTKLQELSLDPIDELNTCVQHHQIILRYANLVQSIFSTTLLLQFATSLLIITNVGFQLFSGKEFSKNELIDSINFLTCALFQLALYCWFGTEVIAKSEGIGISAYSSKWYDGDPRFKKSLSILLCRGQIPIVFTAGNIWELSSQTYVNIISKCYSSMALLNQVNE